jgi:hypothetical protein
MIFPPGFASMIDVHPVRKYHCLQGDEYFFFLSEHRARYPVRTLPKGVHFRRINNEATIGECQSPKLLAKEPSYGVNSSVAKSLEKA